MNDQVKAIRVGFPVFNVERHCISMVPIPGSLPINDTRLKYYVAYVYLIYFATLLFLCSFFFYLYCTHDDRRDRHTRSLHSLEFQVLIETMRYYSSTFIQETSLFF